MTQVVHLELNTSDTKAAQAFYKKVFGWEYRDMQMPDSVYTMLSGGGETFGGMQVNPMPGAPPSWLAYIGVKSIAETVKKVEAAGGRVVMQQPVPGNGVLAVFVDPQGAWIAAWEPETPPAPAKKKKATKSKAAKKKAAKKKTAKKKATKKKAAKKKATKKKATKKKAAKKKATKKKTAKKKKR